MVKFNAYTDKKKHVDRNLLIPTTLNECSENTIINKKWILFFTSSASVNGETMAGTKPELPNRDQLFIFYVFVIIKLEEETQNL